MNSLHCEKRWKSLWNRFFSAADFPRFTFEEWQPSVDISETKDTLLVKAELPGLDAKDVSVTISGDMLTIEGDVKACEKITGYICLIFRRLYFSYNEDIGPKGLK